MYCLDCGFHLVDVEKRQCPECGRAFEPGNLNSFAASGRGSDAGRNRMVRTMDWLETLAYLALITGVIGTLVFLLS